MEDGTIDKTLLVVLISILYSTIFPAKVFAGKPLIQTFSGIYEPSAIVQITPTTLLIGEDDGKRPLISASIVRGKNGPVLETSRLPQLHVSVKDIEGAALGKDKQVFLITSHSDKKGKKHNPARKQLVQITLKGNQITSQRHADTLLPGIRKKLASTNAFKQSSLKTINIEGLTFDPTQEKLLIGLRTPLHNKKSIILTLNNPYNLISKGQHPVFTDNIIILDMQGGGIRAMAYDRTLGIYLLANEIKNKKRKMHSRLWAWDGTADHPPSRVRLPKMKKTKNIEGIVPIQFNNSHFILLVCDDGNKKQKKGAHFIFVNTRDISF